MLFGGEKYNKGKRKGGGNLKRKEKKESQS
jgi:hypothetical protein